MPGEWIAQLPDDLKTNETLTGYPTLGDFAKDHIGLKGKVSELDGKIRTYEGKVGDLEKRLGDSIPKLSDKATDAEKAAYYKALGVPDKPEEYEFTKQDGDAHVAMENWARGTFHKLGVPKATAKALSDEFVSYVDGIAEGMESEQKKAFDEAEAAIKKEWGDKFDENKKISQSFFVKLSQLPDSKLDEEIQYFQDTFGNDLRAIRFIFNLAKIAGEPVTPGGSQQTTPQLTPGVINYPDMKKK